MPSNPMAQPSPSPIVTISPTPTPSPAQVAAWARLWQLLLRPEKTRPLPAVKAERGQGNAPSGAHGDTTHDIPSPSGCPAEA
jgi:hypothetical protein